MAGALRLRGHGHPSWSGGAAVSQGWLCPRRKRPSGQREEASLHGLLVRRAAQAFVGPARDLQQRPGRGGRFHCRELLAGPCRFERNAEPLERASAFVLHELLGYPQVRNYDGSWTEWGSLVGAPIER